MRRPCPIPQFVVVLLFLLGGCKTPSILVTQEQQLGDASFNAHDYEAAATHYGTMLEASAKLGIYRNLSMEADVHRKIANCNEMLGRYPEALEHVRAAARLDSTENNPLERIEDLRQEGMIRLYMGDYIPGIASLERSLDLNEGMDESLKNTNRLSIADTYLALGRAQSATGSYGEALDNLGRSLDLYRLTRSEAGEMESLLAMGEAYSDLGNLPTARSDLENSRQIAGKIRMSTARQERGLAVLETSLGNYENALRHQEEALSQAGQYNIAGQRIWFTIGMGDIYREIGDLDRAEHYYREAERLKDSLSMKSLSTQASMDLRSGRFGEALEYFTREGSRVGAGISALRLGEVCLLRQQFDSASVLYGQAADWFRQAGSRMGFANAELHRGQILVDLDQLPQAKLALDSAEGSGDFPENLWQIWFHRGRMFEKAGRPDEARRAYEESIRIIEGIRGNLSIEEFRSSYLENKREVYERLIDLLERTGNSESAFKTSERAKARTFLDMIANNQIDYKELQSSELVREEQEIRFKIRNLYRLLQSGDVEESSGIQGRKINSRAIYEELRSSQEEYQEILLQIKLHHPDYSQLVTVEPATLEEIRKELDQQTAVLAYWVGEEETHAWLITRDGFLHRQLAIGSEEVQEKVESVRRSIAAYYKSERDPLLSGLYEVLLKPLESGLKGIKELVVVPNGPLHFLPFQVLVDGRGKYLVERYGISYAPSASVYLVCASRERAAGENFLGMALGDVSVGNYSGLPATADEVSGIRKDFTGDSKVFLAAGCTETAMKAESPGYRYIHLATHGSYNYFQPLYSFLLFNPSDQDDGRLTVQEVFGLSLHSNLVTLSACETGLGNLDRGDELEGLSRAFLYAGSSSVIVSLWSVADYQTSLLMEAFYAHLQDHPAGEALAMAQRELLGRFPQPFYWAPFILVGNQGFSMH